MLTSDQMRFFEEFGYLVVEDVLDETAIIQPIRAEYSLLMDRLYQTWFEQGRVSTPPDALDFESKLLNAYQAGCDWFPPMDISLPGDRIKADSPMHFGPAVFDLLTDSRLLDLVQCFLGSEITSTPIQHVRIKLPATDVRQDEIRPHITTTDWHQDRGVALAEADHTNMVTVWCAISDATVENGCLQVIPGGHLQGMKPHCPKIQTAIPDGLIDEAAAIPLPVKSGGVIVFHPLVPHASLANTTSSFRWSFDIRYNKTGEPTGRPQFPEFVARSQQAPETELTDWRIWQSLWENARAQLAQQAHQNIHRWASDAPYCA
mgnify:CR=1 FL=1